MPHHHPGRQLVVGRQPAGRGPGEDVHLDAPPGQAPGGLDDVDVQPARVPGAGLLQRGGVHAEHRHAAQPRHSASCGSPGYGFGRSGWIDRRNVGPHTCISLRRTCRRSSAVGYGASMPTGVAEQRRERRLVRAGLRRGPPDPLAQVARGQPRRDAHGQRLPGGVQHDQVGPRHRDLQVDPLHHAVAVRVSGSECRSSSNTTPRYVAPRAETSTLSIRTLSSVASRCSRRSAPRPSRWPRAGRDQRALHDRLERHLVLALHPQAGGVHRDGQPVAEGDDPACLLGHLEQARLDVHQRRAPVEQGPADRARRRGPRRQRAPPRGTGRSCSACR